jgi:hypothetical protein
MLAGHNFARVRQALTAFGLAAQMRENVDRALAARCARGGTHLIVAKGIAVADDHETASLKRTTAVANHYRPMRTRLQVTLNKLFDDIPAISAALIACPRPGTPL